MKKRVNTAFWVEKEKRWCIAVQKNGTRKRFYSSTPGRTGQREANAKADAWLDDSIRDGRKKVAALYSEWVEELKLTCGTPESNRRTVELQHTLVPDPMPAVSCEALGKVPEIQQHRSNGNAV